MRCLRGGSHLDDVLINRSLKDEPAVLLRVGNGTKITIFGVVLYEPSTYVGVLSEVEMPKATKFAFLDENFWL